MKSSQLLLLSLLILIIAGVGSYLYFSREKKEYLPAAFALPASTAIAYQGQDIRADYQIIEKSGFYGFLRQNPSVLGFDKEYRYFDSLFHAREEIGHALGGKPMIISLHVTSAEDFQLLFLQQTNGDYDKDDLEEWVNGNIPGARIFERVFEDRKLYDVKNEQKQAVFSFCFMDGIIALSRNPLLVEDAISGFKVNRKKNSPLVEKMVATLASSRLFLNFIQLPALLNTYVSGEYREYVRSLSDLGDYGVYDLKAENDRIQLTGTAYASSEKNSYWTALLDQHAQRPGVAEVLPIPTAFLMHWGVDDFTRYFSKLKVSRQSSGSQELFEQAEHDLENEEGISLENDLVPLIGQQWAYALSEPTGSDTLPAPMMVFQPKDGNEVLNRLRAVNEKVASKKQSGTAPQTYRNYTIERIGFSGGFDLLFGSAFSRFDHPYYTMLGSYVVFCNDVPSLQRSIDAFVDNATLSRSADWQKFSSQLASESNLLLYINPARATLLGSHFIRENYKSKYTENLPVYTGMQGFGFQLASNQTSFYSQVTLSSRATGTTTGNAELVWSVNTEDEIDGKPWVVDNPEGRKKEILVLDKAHNLYLISNAGSILWKKNLTEPIVGDVQQIDLYKSNQRQFLFTTPTRLMLLDHDGQDAGGYPIRLGSPTRTGIALFDFDNTKDYVYYIGAERNRIYGYYANGKPLQGWGPMTVDGQLAMPLKYFSLKGQIYLLGITDKGILYLWDKKGNLKVKPIATGSRFTNPFKLIFGGSLEQCELFSVDTAGVLYRLRLNGTIVRKQYPVSGGKPFFDYLDTDGDGKMEYLITSGDIISSYEGPDTSAQWQIQASGKVSFPPQLVRIQGRDWIGYVRADANEVQLLSRAGTPYQGFPQKGFTPFVIDDLSGESGKEMVIGGQGKILYLYRLSH